MSKIKTKTSNPKCDKCAKSLNGHCTAKSFKECPLATIQSAFSQFDKVVRCQCGQSPEQSLLVAVLNQAVLDCVHMYKPRGQFNPYEAMAFIKSDNAKALCKVCELDYEWYSTLAVKFVEGVKRAGLKSVGNERSKKNAEKRKQKGTV